MNDNNIDENKLAGAIETAFASLKTVGSMDANKLIDAIEIEGYSARSYSGRGMYGKRCVGVVTKNAFQLGTKIAAALLADEEDGSDLVGQLARLQVCEDSMGLDTIVYFPKVEWPAGRAETDEDEEDEG